MPISHTPIGSPRGVLVHVEAKKKHWWNRKRHPFVTGVTYGGIALRLLDEGQNWGSDDFLETRRVGEDED